MSDALKKVQPGQPLIIPAAAYNAFIDAALDFRERTALLGQSAQPAVAPSGLVLVRNDSGSDRKRFDILGVSGPVIDPAHNEAAFKNRLALAGVAPAVPTHEGRFVVLAEPLASGQMGRAFAAGVCLVRLEVPNESHAWVRAEITEASGEFLRVHRRGSATILWRAGGWGVQWAVVRLGGPIPPHVLPVKLLQVGGEQGTESQPASWLYDVYDPKTDQLIQAWVDPTSPPHQWRRPPVGQMIPATFGYAHFEEDGTCGCQLVLGWINEVADQESCNSGSGSGA